MVNWTQGLVFLFSLALGSQLGLAKPEYKVGKNPWLKSSFKKQDVLPSIKAGADYLIRNQLPDGQFVYIKDPLGKNPKPSDRYSLIRHLGSAFALLKAYQVSGTPLYLNSAKMAIDFGKGFLKPYKNFKIIRGIKKRPDIGESGFMLIVTALYDHLSQTKTYAGTSRSLAKFIKVALKYDGPWSTKGGWAENQAIIGLAHWYLFHEPDAKIVDIVENWLAAYEEDERSSHWSVQAYYWFSLIDPKQGRAFNQYALESAEEILEDVGTREENSGQRLIGARNEALQSCNSTARNEGVIAAWQIASQTGNRKATQFFAKRVREHLAFAMQFQYGNPYNLYDNDKKMQRVSKLFDMSGGVYNDPKTGHVRIDYVSHHIRALAAWLLGNSPGALPKTLTADSKSGRAF
jgi:hypothetical protein